MKYRMASLAVAVAARAAFVFAGDAAVVPNPAEPPLTLIRMARPDAVEKILSSRQARVLGLDASDFSGIVPGLGGRVDSLRGLLRNLDAARTENLWLCLFTRGGTLFNMTAVLGGERPVSGGTDLPAWFGKAGWSGDKVAFRESGGERMRFALARDEASLRESLDGPGERTGGRAAGGWRAGMRRFMEKKTPGVGLWLNPRPLSGILSLAAGIDPRVIAREFGVSIPESIEMEFLPDGEDVGLEARLNGVLPQAADAAAGTRPRLGPSRKNTLGEVRLTAPALLVRQFGWEEKNPLFALNLKLSPLLPRAARLEFFRKGGGGVAWSLVCLMEKGPETRKQMRRLRAWLDFLAGSAIGGVRVERGETSRGEGIWRLSAGADSCVAGFTERGGDLFFLAAADERDYPDLGDLIITEEREAGILFWECRPDAAALDDAAALATELLAGGGVARPEPELLRAVLAGDVGGVRLDGKSVTLHSRTGAGPLLLAALARQAGEAKPEKQDDGNREWDENPLLTVGDRLRFLLGVAHQARFRGLGPDRLRPEALPERLDALLFTGDPEGMDWLETTFPHFPGGGLSVAEALAGLAAGAPLDGYAYAIAGAGDAWRITALDETGDGWAMDAGGEISPVSGSVSLP